MHGPGLKKEGCYGKNSLKRTHLSSEMTLFAADACSRLDDDVNFVLARSNENRRVREEEDAGWLAGWLAQYLL